MTKITKTTSTYLLLCLLLLPIPVQSLNHYLVFSTGLAINNKATEKQLAAKKASDHASPGNNSKSASSGSVVRGKILETLRSLHLLPTFKGLEVTKLAMAVGFKHRDSKGFRNPLSELKEEGIVVLDKGIVVLSSEEIDKLPKQKANGIEGHLELMLQMVEQTKSKVKPEGIRQIFSVLGDGKIHTMEELLEATGYKRADSGGFKNTWKLFNEMDYIQRPGKGQVQLADKLLMQS